MQNIIGFEFAVKLSKISTQIKKTDFELFIIIISSFNTESHTYYYTKSTCLIHNNESIYQTSS